MLDLLKSWSIRLLWWDERKWHKNSAMLQSIWYALFSILGPQKFSRFQTPTHSDKDESPDDDDCSGHDRGKYMQAIAIKYFTHDTGSSNLEETHWAYSEKCCGEKGYIQEPYWGKRKTTTSSGTANDGLKESISIMRRHKQWRTTWQGPRARGWRECWWL